MTIGMDTWQVKFLVMNPHPSVMRVGELVGPKILEHSGKKARKILKDVAPESVVWIVVLMEAMVRAGWTPPDAMLEEDDLGEILDVIEEHLVADGESLHRILPGLVRVLQKGAH